MKKRMSRKILLYSILGLVGFATFAVVLIDGRLLDALQATNVELEDRAGKVALQLEERISHVCDGIRLVSLNPIIQEGDEESVKYLLEEIMSFSSLGEALLVMDYDGSLVAEEPAGWYHHYLKLGSDLESSRGYLLNLDGTGENGNYVFARAIQAQKQGRSIVAFANLHYLSELALLGNRDDKILLFTEEGHEIGLNEPKSKARAPLLSTVANIVGRIYHKRASTYLQGIASVSKQEWLITVSRPFESFLASTAVDVFSGFDFYLVLFFPVLIVLLFIVFAVNHSRRYFREQAYRDGLTGLFNHRFFQAELRALVNEERIRDVSLVMVDIDDFKKCNDKYGHQAGDEILQQVSNILLANIRSTDVAARYGGEEFALILPGVGLKGALGVAERIRRSVKAECGITVSLGVSSFPQYASTVEDLIRSADKALYKAKGMGKDQVVAQPNGFGVNNGDCKSTSLDTANKFLDSEI
mgnify:CR=1 FL=1|jgi:diguanylate cyclase (GGDEF)-like protein